MELEVAEWLSDLIRQTGVVLQQSPGLTIEVDEQPAIWVQVIPEADETGELSGYVLNLPYEGVFDEPLEHIPKAGIQLPPDTRIIGWEAGAYTTLWIRPDVPVLPLALLIGDLIEKIGGTPDVYNLTVEVLHSL
jgi:hypothetical protein